MMSKVLHIVASPRGDRSYSLRVARAFLESYQEAHPDDVIETLDLAGPIPEFDATAVAGKYRIMHGESHTDEEAKAWKSVQDTIDAFKAADKVVISAPTVTTQPRWF